MKNQFLGLFLLSLFPASLFAQTVEQDTSVRQGKLKNGLTYYIRHNNKEAGLADFYIAQRVGSILEEPRQRGLAHFLEHMAFNGTKHFPGKGKKLGIVPWCETIGVKFGANLNAYTSVDQTVYHIGSAPVKREGIIDSCLLVLNDWSQYINLEPKEIDKERGVIHEEWRNRRTGMAMQRMMENVMPKSTREANMKIVCLSAVWMLLITFLTEICATIIRSGTDLIFRPSWLWATSMWI